MARRRHRLCTNDPRARPYLTRRNKRFPLCRDLPAVPVALSRSTSHLSFARGDRTRIGSYGAILIVPILLNRLCALTITVHVPVARLSGSLKITCLKSLP